MPFPPTETDAERPSRRQIGTARVWTPGPAGTWTVQTLTGHADGVRSAAFSPDGTRVVTTSVNDINTLTTAIADINGAIVKALGVSQGQTPNDLLDQRDALVFINRL